MCATLVIILLYFIQQSSGLDVTVTNITYGTSQAVEINTNHQEVLAFYPDLNQITPYTVYTWLNGSPDELVTVTVQHKVHSLFWTLPFNLSSSTHVSNVSRTLCYDSEDYNDPFFINLSTYSETNVSITVLVKMSENFYPAKGQNYTVDIAPGQPKYYYYKFKNPNHLVNITLSAMTPNSSCLMALVQRNYCPVVYLNDATISSARYQFINFNGAFIFNSSFAGEEFYLVLLALDSKNGSSHNSYNPFYVSFQISEVEPRTRIATSITLGVYTCFVAIAIAIMYGFTRYQRESAEYDTLQEIQEIDNSPNNEPKATYERNRSSSKEYTMYALNTAIFYLIPVIQLVLSYLKLIERTGNEDECYFNFKCATPVGQFGEFNHIFSNVGYIILGVLFLGHVKYHSVVFGNNEYEKRTYYGLFYAMGLGLITLGILSACYHVCPNNINFQFDTTFMYIIGVLYMIKLYEKQHKNHMARAQSTFFVMGVLVAIVSIAIIYSQSYWIFLAAKVFGTGVYIILCTYVSFAMYYTSENPIPSIMEHIRLCRMPQNRRRFVIIVIANCINYIILGVIITQLEFGSLWAFIMLFNAFLYAAIYTAIELRKGIPIHALIYAVLAIASWIPAAYFFYKKEYDTANPPPESKMLNKSCSILDFYDNHDLWHFFSSFGLYFNFMYLLVIDNNRPQQLRE